ncbi:hypothetical protein MMC28_001411 [Mycoblastus sanguinarius]|nr:hypothetical protein [Mycoblastus sanguinarius]
MVSELVPASLNCRQTLNGRREKQRTERLWLYNVVEIGAGSFFLVDQFLKTRAGENVLALMVSIVPLMSPDACTSVLSVLFDAAGVPPDHSPGVNQFLKLRNGLIPFTRKVGFHERVLQYHALLERLSSSQPSAHNAPQRNSPFNAMPAKHHIPRIIQLCHKVSTSGDNCVMVFKGPHGSGWVAAYVSFILGLPVCVVDHSGNQVPRNDNYGKAKVILEPSAGQSECELLVAGVLHDFITLEGLDAASRCGWSISCREVNFLLLNHPELENPTQVDALSDFAAIATLNQVAR